MTKKPKQYTRGLSDVERVMELLDKQEKAERRAHWIKEHYSNKEAKKLPNTKEEA